MRLLKYVPMIAFPIILLGIVLEEMGVKSLGFKLYARGALVYGMVIGVTVLCSIRADY